LESADLFNEYDNLIDNLFQSLNPLTGCWCIPGNYTPGYHGLRKIVLVAPQCDRFHPDDWGILELLLQHWKKLTFLKFPRLFVECMICSAVKSTTRVANGCLGMPLSDGKAQSFNVYRLENSPFQNGWPDEWNSEGISIPSVSPYMPPKMDAVPNQHNLNKVFQSVTGWFK
jgi:hypothetical protein